jgi:uncharacterized repeat protein (TIGR03803 family)
MRFRFHFNGCLERFVSIASCLAIAACSNGVVPLQSDDPDAVARPGAVREAAEPGYRVLHSFGRRGDGIAPHAGLLMLRGTLYGGTPGGGLYYKPSRGQYGGTIFSLTPAGSEKVIHNFGDGSDGNSGPSTSLINVNGRLTGTTSYEGPASSSSLFSITATEKLHLLYAFDGGTAPTTSLLLWNGNLYGTTLTTVFSMNTSGGNYRILHTFAKTQGSAQSASLIEVNGTLFGTTASGGAYRAGTVFSLSPSGSAFHILHNFGHGTDGSYPLAGLTALNGDLYGTTSNGGAYRVGSVGGTAFTLATNGTNYRVLHSFGSGADGNYPIASLLAMSGTLYGTTYFGGNDNDGGTIFSVTPAGTETLLHSFGASKDGMYPAAALTGANGTLYGTTSAGGTSGSDSASGGTAFALTP